MFEFAKIRDELEFRRLLRENGWLKRFLVSYLFEEGFVYFDEKRFLAKAGVPKLGRGQSARQQIISHVNGKRKDMVGTQMHLQSFQYLINVIGKLKQNLRAHYEILLPYLLMLDEEDLPFVVDVLLGKFRVSKMQKQILKGGL